MKTLDAIGIDHGTDKCSRGHDYLNFYEKWFAPLRDKPIRLFEMGTLGGNSLRAWREYFPHADITGLELEAAYWKPENDPKMRVINGSQNDNVLLHGIAMAHGPFDIIIDDAGHFYDGQVTAFNALFHGEHLKSGGIYIIEDIHAAYWPEYNDNGKKRLMPWLYELIDDRVMHRGTRKYNAFTDKDRIKSVTFRKGVVLFEKL